MERHIVVALRTPPAGMSPAPADPYLPRARSVCARGEALGGRLVAWSAELLAIAWDADSMEEAVAFAAAAGEGAPPAGPAWSGGIAEGEIEPLAPDGQRMHLAWGEALIAATGLARVARAGEVLVDGGVRALRAGQLALLGSRSSTDGGRRVRGWRLDLDRPWKPGALGADFHPAGREGGLAAPAGVPAPAESGRFLEEVSTAQVLEIIDAGAPEAAPPGPGDAAPVPADRVRALALGEAGVDPVLAVAELRRARGEADDGPAAARCRISLALAVTLSLAGRLDEALLDALDALACAREARRAEAVDACIALLSRLYAGAGFPDAAARLRADAR